MKIMLSAKLLFTICLSLALSAPAMAQLGGKKLMPTTMDSFVRQAQGNAELIYGDEGHEGPPPFSEFEYMNRINNGIFDTRDKGLTTGHGTELPSAWGRDEFLGAEWYRSGANGGNVNPQGAGVAMDRAGNPQLQQSQTGYGSYTPGANWITVRNPDTAAIMGYMAPGETYQDFFSGASGHIFPEYSQVGKTILQDYPKAVPTGPATSGAGF
ncbi:MAG TPA: hypothetical protein V6C76_17915 [Drouetiella sp.]